MKTSDRLVVVDVGSHKLEELLVFLDPFWRQVGIYLRWATKNVVKAILRADVSVFGGIGRQLKVIKYYFIDRRYYNLQIVCIEPNMEVALPFVRKLSKKYSIRYIPAAVLGHDAKVSAELKTLYFYDESISSSIYQKNRPADDHKSKICIGLRFDVIWNGLIREGWLKSDTSFLLRMNCEGAELGVIEDCMKIRLKPLCIIGSLGDVDKIHGQDSGDATRKNIAEMGAPYFYFKGDDPSTWHDMIPVWEKYTSAYRNR